MSVLVNKNSKVIVQGFTGSEGSFHAQQMMEYGTNVVGGVTPGKGGTEHLGRPVFNTVAEAVTQASADTSIIFVPPAFAADAIMEAADAGIKVIITITEGIPTKDMIAVKQYLSERPSVTMIGPNCPRRDDRRRVQSGHHARLHFSKRQNRHRVQVGHANL
jgi:succinyl-CoA synthetase alpha subunit